MYNSANLTLYTQNNCAYCNIMKQKLLEWGFEYREVNLSYDLHGRSFMKEMKLRTVPQLFRDRTHLNKNVDTVDFTKQRLLEELDFENYQGGVESWA